MKILTLGESETKDLVWLESEFIPAANNKIETIFVQCNGRMGLRGAHEINCANRKAQCYLAGFYHQASPDEPDELVNFPDLLAFKVTVGGVALNLDDRSSLVGYLRTFNLTTGELNSNLVFQINQQTSVQLDFARFVSFADKSLFCHKLSLRVSSAGLPVTIQTGIDGQVSNEGVSHLRELQFRVMRHTMLLQAECAGRPVLIQTGLSLSHDVEKHLARRDYLLTRRRINCVVTLLPEAGQTYEFIKLSRITLPGKRFDSNEDLSSCLDVIPDDLSRGYDHLLDESQHSLSILKVDSSIQIEGIEPEERGLIAYAQHQLLGMIPDQADSFSIGAKGLTGEGYRGHVFWDTEIYLLPFYTNLSPAIARNLLRFRCRGLDGAREKSRDYGFQGALFPWEVTTDGLEKTPPFAQMNIHTGKANPVWSGRKEHHISADIAYAIQKYVSTTRDWEFLYSEAFPMVIETAQFWVSRSNWDEARGCYRILDVIGPDEYTEHVDDNAYTNYLAAENVRFALELLQHLAATPYASQWEPIYPVDELAEVFQTFLEKIILPSPSEHLVIPQDATFLHKPVIPGLEKYIDHPVKQAILLDYSRDEVVAHQVLKQADVILLQILLPDSFSEPVKKANLDFYEPKTLHDSSLSPSAHAIAYADVGDLTKATQYFSKSLHIDVNDHLSDSTDGLHAAALGGIWLALIRGFAGIDPTVECLKIDPCLPPHWKLMRFCYRYAGNQLQITITDHQICIRNLAPAAEKENRCFWVKTGGQWVNFDRESVIRRKSESGTIDII